MRCFKYISVVCLAAVLVGCATQPRKVFPPPADYVPIGEVQILSKFQTIDLTRENFAFEVNKCIPQISINSESLNKGLFSFPRANIASYGHMSSASEFWINKTVGICLRKSSEKFAILAAEAFFNTVNPMGVPPDIVDGWYKQISLLIATKGVAKVAYSFEKGTAFVVDYWIEPRHIYKLNYSSSFKKVGDWESEKIDVRFSYPSMSSVTETKTNGRAEKLDLLSHRLP